MAFSSVRSHSADYHSRSAHKADKEFLDIDIIIGLEIEADAFPAQRRWRWRGKLAVSAGEI